MIIQSLKSLGRDGPRQFDCKKNQDFSLSHNFRVNYPSSMYTYPRITRSIRDSDPYIQPRPILGLRGTSRPIPLHAFKGQKRPFSLYFKLFMSIVSGSNRGSRSPPKHEKNAFISKPAINFQRHRAAARPTAVDSTLSSELIHLTGRTFTSSGFQCDKIFINPQNSDGKIVFLFLVKNKRKVHFYALMDLVFHTFSLEQRWEVSWYYLKPKILRYIKQTITTLHVRYLDPKLRIFGNKISRSLSTTKLKCTCLSGLLNISKILLICRGEKKNVSSRDGVFQTVL